MVKRGMAIRKVGGFLLVLGVLVALPWTVLAQTSTPTEGHVPCQTCHDEELQAWQDSPHAEAGINCETCHGPLVEGHPGRANMPLGVDSAQCKECHTQTAEQWATSLHASKGVQCISCHLSHSQDFRLTDEALCGSCHRDVMQDFDHSTHQASGVECTTCHLSTPMGATDEEAAMASHKFSIESEVCVGCHGDSVHKADNMLLLETASVDNLRILQEQVLQLTDKMQSLEQTNRTLRSLTIINLGWGIGSGIVVGIVFILAVGYVIQRRSGQ